MDVASNACTDASYSAFVSRRTRAGMYGLADTVPPPVPVPTALPPAPDDEPLPPAPDKEPAVPAAPAPEPPTFPKQPARQAAIPTHANEQGRTKRTNLREITGRSD